MSAAASLRLWVLLLAALPNAVAAAPLPAPAAVPAAVPAPALVAAVPDIQVRIGPDEPEVGLVMTVTVTVSGAEGADCALLDVPVVQNGRLSAPTGPSHQSYTEIVNGRTRQSVSTIWQFELVPEKVGSVYVPPFRLSCRGEEVASQPQVFQVGPSTLIEDIVRMELRTSSTEVWVGQVVDVEVELSILETAHDMLARNGLELFLPWLQDQPGLHMLEPPVPACSRGVMTALPSERQIPTCTDRRKLDGKVRILYTQTIPMLATAAGTFSLPESRFSARVVIERGRDDRDAFGFFRTLRAVPSRTMITDARTPGPVLVVREPPVAGRPAEYINAVGSFRFEADAKPVKLAVGESCTLRLSLSPVGGPAPQIALIEWPGFERALTDFRLFGKESGSSSRGRTLELELSPINERVKQIPELAFAWFDPVSKRYVRETVGPIALEVLPGGREGLSELVTPQEILNDLETIRESLPEPAAAQPPVWLLPALAFVMVLLVETRARSQRWKLGNPAVVRRRGARADLIRQLLTAADVRAVAAAFSLYLAARFNGPAGGMTAEEAAGCIPEGELRQRLSQQVSGWEAAYLGGASLEVGAAKEQARELAQHLEQLS